eukprot:scaffold1378_cov24-Tisochrysis_lutea.AAC.4
MEASFATAAGPQGIDCWRHNPNHAVKTIGNRDVERAPVWAMCLAGHPCRRRASAPTTHPVTCMVLARVPAASQRAPAPA